jgi:dTDP-4-amino-4,6-dideoxygalactose transaminase
MISTDDLDAAEYFRNYRNFGRQNINESYDITQEGFKFYMNNLNATIALISLEKYKKDLKTRKTNYSKLIMFYPMMIIHLIILLPS